MPYIPFAEIRSPRLHAFAAYLEGKCKAGPFARGDFDPIVEIPAFAGSTTLIEQIREGEPDAGRFRARLVGSKLVAITGYEHTGKWLDEIGMMPGMSWQIDELRTMFASTEMFCGSDILPFPSREHVTIEWVAMRFAHEPGVNDLLIFGFDKRQDAMAG